MGKAPGKPPSLQVSGCPESPFSEPALTRDLERQKTRHVDLAEITWERFVRALEAYRDAEFVGRSEISGEGDYLSPFRYAARQEYRCDTITNFCLVK